MQSMTGFSRLESQQPGGLMVWELRSVNHRYLELNFRMPEEFRLLEINLRKKAQALLQRGKLDCSFRFNPLAGDAVSLDFNESLLNALLTKVDLLEQRKSGLQSVNPMDLLAWPGVIAQSTADQEQLNHLCIELFERTLSVLVQNRSQEGCRIAELIRSRCEKLHQLVRQVRSRRQQVVEDIRSKIVERIKELSIDVDQQRLEQELVYLAQKLDVEEELDRLDCHIAETQSVLEQTKPAGRRLDFLLQEFNREANTLSSKSADIQTTKAAVEMKVLIEQMREQVQNLQ